MSQFLRDFLPTLGSTKKCLSSTENLLLTIGSTPVVGLQCHVLQQYGHLKNSWALCFLFGFVI